MEDADLVLEKNLTVSGKPLLTIPYVPSTKIMYQIPYHQCLVAPDQEAIRFELKDEIEDIYKFFSAHGAVVDLNFSYFPEFIVPTYTRNEHVNSLQNMCK